MSSPEKAEEIIRWAQHVQHSTVLKGKDNVKRRHSVTIDVPKPQGSIKLPDSIRDGQHGLLAVPPPGASPMSPKAPRAKSSLLSPTCRRKSRGDVSLLLSPSAQRKSRSSEVYNLNISGDDRSVLFKERPPVTARKTMFQRRSSLPGPPGSEVTMSFLYSSAVDRAVSDHLRGLDGSSSCLPVEPEVTHRKKHTVAKKMCLPVQFPNLPQLVQTMSTRWERTSHQGVCFPGGPREGATADKDKSPFRGADNAFERDDVIHKPTSPKLRPVRTRRSSIQVL